MHQTKKGNAWHFGTKAHIGVDVVSGLVHTVVGTAASVADVVKTSELLHGQEVSLHPTQGTRASRSAKMQGKKLDYFMAEKRSLVERLPEGPERDSAKSLEKAKAQVRAIVEHPFHVLKNLFQTLQDAHRGLRKNTAQLFTLFAIANLFLARRWLLPSQGGIAS